MPNLAEREPTTSAPGRAVNSPTLPLALTVLRLCLAPGVILLAILHLRGAWMVACIVTALLSDYFDGVLARHLGVVTEALRRFDSVTDTVFYLGVLCAVWLLERLVVLKFGWLFATLLAVELIRALYELRKFGHLAAYHMWSAKTWGLLVAIATIALLGYGYYRLLLPATLIVGIVSDVEGFAISLLLKRSQHDVPTIFHALRLRRATA